MPGSGAGAGTTATGFLTVTAADAAGTGALASAVAADAGTTAANVLVVLEAGWAVAATTVLAGVTGAAAAVDALTGVTGATATTDVLVAGLTALAPASEGARPAAGGVAAGTKPGFTTAMPGPLTVLPVAVEGPAATGVAANLFSSPIFLASSATRVDASLVCRSLETLSSAAVLLFRSPLDNVNLSGMAATGALSSILAWTLPPAWRVTLPTCVGSALSASLRRKSLKSRDCAAIVVSASAGDMSPASSALGISNTVPDFKRLMLPLMKASGLLLSNAASI